MTTRVTQTIVTQKQYDMVMKDVMSLKPNKRKNFKGYMTDKHGIRTKVRFIDGKLMCYSTKVNQMTEVVTSEVIKEGEWEATSNLGVQIELMHKAVDSLKDEQSVKDLNMTEDELNVWLEERRNNLYDAIMDKHIKDNHTGNSYRNHTITIKTSRKSAPFAF